MSDPFPPSRSCPQCGAALPAGAGDGLCPACLVAEAMPPPDEDAWKPDTVPMAGPAGTAARRSLPDFPLPEELNALLPPDTYRIDGVIGRGGMGAVYRGTQLRLQRAVAVKIMRRDQGRDHGFEQRFQREALAMAKLNHPNIVSVIDYGEAGPDYLYIVMELVDGADMMDVIRTGRMTQELALTLLPQICDALQFAHDHGIIHRDIKPGNIMLTRHGRIKMADFGLAKRFDVESSFHTQSGTGMGTPDYAAPEQFNADGPIDHRADIYSLGVMIYQMITGQLPRGVWKPPSQQAGCDPLWDEIVSHAMQTDPRDRYQAASEIKTDLSRIASSEIRAAVPSAPVDGPAAGEQELAAPAGAGALRKSRTPLVLAVLVGAAVLAGGAFLVLEQPGRQQASAASGTEGETAAAAFTFAGHRYQFVPGAVSWEEARAKAEAMGGHLVSIGSREECDWIYATFGSQLDGARRSASIWLGASAQGSGQPFTWVTGEPFSFTDWNKDEPHFTTTSGQPAKGPFAIAIKSRGALRWFDDPTDRRNTSAGFIIEWEK